MADPKVSNGGDSAEKAYAAAAKTVEPKPVEFPAKATRGSQPRPAAKTGQAIQAAAAPAKAKPAAIKPQPAPPEPAQAETSTPATTTTDSPEFSRLKDNTMATQTTDFTARDTVGGFKDVFADVKTKAKAAFEKGASSLGDYTDFAKGNVEATVESGKIFAAGLQELGSTCVAESKTAFEAMTADAKELAAQKTPTDFFKLQSEIARKNFESAMAFGTKSSEAWMKLAGDAFAPLSGRVNLAVEKIKTTA